MTGRHAMTRDVALSALNSPAGRGLAAAMAVGTMFGVALPTASADEGAATNAFGGPVTDLAAVDTAEGTEAVTAPADANLQIEQVQVAGGGSSATPTAQTVSTIEADVQAPPPPVVQTPAPSATAEASKDDSGDARAEASESATRATRTSAHVQQAAVPAKESAAEAPAAAHSGNGSAVLNTALSYVGSSYRWGGTTPSGWDCIGFVRYVYGKYGVNIGGYTTSVLSVGTRVPYSQAQPGDILYWPGHVGIYAGGGQNVGAWNESMGTRVGPNSWVGGTPVVIRVF